MNPTPSTPSAIDRHRQAPPFSTADLEYVLPNELIAQEPAVQREDARLLVVDRAQGTLSDRAIRDLPDLLASNDLLVLNNTEVVPARFRCRRATGGAVNGLFIEDRGTGTWRVMLEGSRRLRVSERLAFVTGQGDRESFQFVGSEPRTSVRADSRMRGLPAHVDQVENAQDMPTLELVERLSEGQWIVRVGSDEPAFSLLKRFGQTPLPPYIKRRGADSAAADVTDRHRYQTIYAQVPGAVAAPTAGLHFTEALLERMRQRGVANACVTLHVGVGTFKPIATKQLADHVMHSEWFDLPNETARAVNACGERGGRVVAVGTTSLRVLESAARNNQSDGSAQENAPLRGYTGWTDLFVYPPYRFRIVDALLTNFHLPQSTLLALVMAFAGVDVTKQAYGHAIENAYRFYSYGDAMLIV